MKFQYGAKRFLAIGLLLLCACVPTPEEEFVAAKTEPHPIQTEAVQSSAFPARCDKTFAIDKGLLTEIRYAAEIERPEYDSFPIVRVTPVSFDGKTVECILSAFAPDTRIVSGADSTVTDIEAEIQETLDHIDNVDAKTFESEEAKEHYLAEERELLAELQEAYRNAQGTEPIEMDCAALAAQDRIDFSLIDGEGNTVARGRLVCGLETGDPRASKLQLQIPGAEPNAAEQSDDEQSLTLCEAFLQAAGIQDFAFSQTEQQREIHTFVYTRTVEGMPYTNAYRVGNVQAEESFDESLRTEPYWLDESIRLICIGGRVASVEWCSKCDYASTAQNAAVLPFDEVLRKITNGLTFRYSTPVDEAEQSHRIVVESMQLGYKRVPVYQAVRAYQLIPVWSITGRTVQKYRDASDNSELILDANNEWTGSGTILLVVSAIDGSIVG